MSARPRTTRPAVRRGRSWADSRGSITGIAVNGTGSVDALAFFRAAGGETSGVTIGAIHLDWQCVTSTTAVAGDEIIVALAVYNRTIALASPVASPMIDWMWNRSHYSESTNTATFPNKMVGEDHVMSFRKLSEIGDTLQLGFYNATATPNLTVFYHLRALVIES